MSALPPGIFFVNGDISYPPTKTFIGDTLTQIGSSAGPDSLTTLVTQLFIDDVMTKEEFDARMAADPNYSLIVHLRGFRILVIVPQYYDQVNRQYADVVMFLHQGLVDVESNQFAWPIFGTPCSSCCSGDGYGHTHIPGVATGPPGQCYDLQRINMYDLLRAGKGEFSGSGCCAVVPWFAFTCNQCSYPFFCDMCHTFSGMKVCQSCLGPCGCGCGTILVDQQGIVESPIYAPNCDNEFHNPDFIFRN
jgi:hypothetical protein